MVLLSARSDPAYHGEAELTDEEALALAQLVKRIGWSELRENAVDEEEAYTMRSAVAKLQSALAGAGYAPR